MGKKGKSPEISGEGEPPGCGDEKWEQFLAIESKEEEEDKNENEKTG